MRARNGEREVVGDAVVVCAVKKFLGGPEFPVLEFHHPGGTALKIGFFRVVAGVRHVNNDGVVVNHVPTGNRGAFHIQLRQSGSGLVEFPHIERGLSFEAFELGAEGDILAVGRNVGMVRIDCIHNFGQAFRLSCIVDKGEVAGNVVAENELGTVAVGGGAEFYGADVRRDAFCRVGRFIHRFGVGDFSVRKSEAHVIRPGVGRNRIDVATGEKIDVVGVRPEAPAFYDAFVSSSAVGGADKVRERGVLEFAEPVVHPFHRVAQNIADGRFSLALAAYLVQRVAGIFGTPRLLQVPGRLGDVCPFRFGGESESVGFGMEREAFQAVAVAGVVVRDAGIGIDRIAILALAQGVCIQGRIVEGHVCRGDFSLAIKFRGREQLVEIFASDFVSLDVEVVGELDRHFGPFIRFCAAEVRSQYRGFSGRLHEQEVFDRILRIFVIFVWLGVRTCVKREKERRQARESPELEQLRQRCG